MAAAVFYAVLIPLLYPELVLCGDVSYRVVSILYALSLLGAPLAAANAYV